MFKVNRRYSSRVLFNKYSDSPLSRDWSLDPRKIFQASDRKFENLELIWTNRSAVREYLALT